MTTSIGAPRPSSFIILRNRSFALMWTGQLVSTAGTALTALAGSILIFRLTGSALSVGLLLMAAAVPTLVIGLLAGVFVDRFDRKRIMIASDLIRAVLAFGIPFLVPVSIVWLYAIVMLESAAGQFFDPAHASLLPEIASDEELAAANSLMAISSFGSQSIGFAAAGLIASGLPIAWAFYLDATSYLVSAACIVMVQIAPFRAEGKTNLAIVLHNLREGGRFLFSTPILRSEILIFIPAFILFGFNNSGRLAFATRALHATSFQYGLMEALASIGFVGASLLLARFTDRLREGQWIMVSFLGMALANLVYSLSQSVTLALAAVMLNGFFNAPSVIARQLVIQRNTTREVRGRVNSAFFFTRSVAWLIGFASVALADRFDIRLLFFTCALLLLIVGATVFLLPGLGQPGAQWRRVVGLLRAAGTAPDASAGRRATPADLDELAGRLPALAALGTRAKHDLADQMSVVQAPPGSVIVRRGELSDAAYFILDGRVVVGREEDGAYRPLDVLNAGDFFGEIAALTGVPRTANVVAEQATTLLQAPAATVREMMSDAEISRLFLSRMTERMLRSQMLDLPGSLTAIDQQSLRELRTPATKFAPSS